MLEFKFFVRAKISDPCPNLNCFPPRSNFNCLSASLKFTASWLVLPQAVQLCSCAHFHHQIRSGMWTAKHTHVCSAGNCLWGNEPAIRYKIEVTHATCMYKWPDYSSAQQWSSVQNIGINNNGNTSKQRSNYSEHNNGEHNVEGEKEDHCQPDGCLPLP